MPKIKVDISKYHVFIYKPSNSYIIVERNNDSVFAKLIVIYDYKFERISDSHFTQVQFLDYNNKTNSYCINSKDEQTIRVNKLMDLPIKTKFLIIGIVLIKLR